MHHPSVVIRLSCSLPQRLQIGEVGPIEGGRRRPEDLADDV